MPKCGICGGDAPPNSRASQRTASVICVDARFVLEEEKRKEKKDFIYGTAG